MGNRRVLLTTDAVGGVWRYTIELAAGLAARGGAVTLAVLGPSPDAAQRREAAAIPGLRRIDTGLPLEWIAEDARALHEASAAIVGIARRSGADLVHLHAPSLAGEADFSCPVVVSAHSCERTWWQTVRGAPAPDAARHRVEATARGLSRAEAAIAPSAAFARALSLAYPGTAHPICVRNGLRPSRAPATAREHAVLTCGRLWDEAKNARMLDRVAPSLGVPVRAAGAVQQPVGGRIELPRLEWLGQLGSAAMARAHARHAVFVSLAVYEPFGLSVLEAAQAGAALVLSEIPTFRELWTGAAVFVDPHDPHGVTAGLRHALGAPETLGRAARERARAYTAARMVAETIAVHDGAMVGTRVQELAQVG